MGFMDWLTLFFVTSLVIGASGILMSIIGAAVEWLWRKRQ